MSQLEEIWLMFRLTLVVITLQLTQHTYQTPSPRAESELI